MARLKDEHVKISIPESMRWWFKWVSVCQHVNVFAYYKASVNVARYVLGKHDARVERDFIPYMSKVLLNDH